MAQDSTRSCAGCVELPPVNLMSSSCYAVKRLQCEQCSFSSATYKGLSIHQRKIHTLVNNLPFSRRKAIVGASKKKPQKMAAQAQERHGQSCSMKSETWGAPFKCMICGALHSDKLYLGQHFETHHAGLTEEAMQQVPACSPGENSKPATPSTPSVSATESSANSSISAHAVGHVNVTHASYTSTPIRGPGGQLLGWIRTPTKRNSSEDATSIYQHQFSMPLMNPLIHGPPQYSRIAGDVVYKDESEYASEFYYAPSYQDPHRHGHPQPQHVQQHHQETQQGLQQTHQPPQSYYYGGSATYETRPSDHESLSYNG
ncbi:hypothetical protein BIW11_13061 [Tropilaelaps mercedesae]|uniref:C2H2-type domain-containing protein n=1 Tax=Tropilaelaps mercedesae TaxID=418985 RepID=A0A1V9X3Q1_9ACAR|nr:hypothetical protein BIW11_13061 [Tropilaelaps mercedesae]